MISRLIYLDFIATKQSITDRVFQMSEKNLGHGRGILAVGFIPKKEI
jgi:hypothetical protein